MTQSTQPVLSFIGAGNMAAAIIGGLLAKGYDPKRIWATDLDADKLAQLTQQWGIQTTVDNHQACQAADVVVLAVKPQGLKSVCTELQSTLQQQKPLVISIAAGIEVASMERWMGAGLSLVRCMPNTPALVQTGASGLYANEATSSAQRQQAEAVLGAVGIAMWVDEEAQIDAVTAVSGSGPAYYFLVMEAMIEAGQQLGLSPEVAKQLTLQTALGAATMASQSEFDPAELRRRVTSPKGTTERAIKTFEQGDLRGLFAQALEDCAERSRELALELGKD